MAGARSILRSLRFDPSPRNAMGQVKGPLVSLLAAVEGPQPLVILPHDNPDPDALASAAALQYILRELADKDSMIALGGIIGRAENRAMVKYTNISLTPVKDIEFTAETQVAPRHALVSAGGWRTCSPACVPSPRTARR